VDNHLEEMIRDVGEENLGRVNVYDCLKYDLEQKLSTTLRLFN